MTRLLGVPMAQILFSLSRPLAFALHCRPLNSVRRKYGLKTLGHDLRAVYTDADEVLLADVPDYFPIAPEAEHHRYLGPVPWSPSNKLPAWWQELDNSRPIVYVTLGSSGRVELLPIVLEALAQFPVAVIATTAGRTALESIPENAMVDEYIPGNEAAKIASLVICNGGSLTTYQALSNGTPVLGIVGNLDQHLNMSYLTREGIGEVIRSEQAEIATISGVVRRLLDNPDYTRSAEQARQVLGKYEPHQRFREFVHEIVSA